MDTVGDLGWVRFKTSRRHVQHLIDDLEVWILSIRFRTCSSALFPIFCLEPRLFSTDSCLLGRAME